MQVSEDAVGMACRHEPSLARGSVSAIVLPGRGAARTAFSRERRPTGVRVKTRSVAGWGKVASGVPPGRRGRAEGVAGRFFNRVGLARDLRVPQLRRCRVQGRRQRPTLLAPLRAAERHASWPPPNSDKSQFGCRLPGDRPSVAAARPGGPAARCRPAPDGGHPAGGPSAPPALAASPGWSNPGLCASAPVGAPLRPHLSAPGMRVSRDSRRPGAHAGTQPGRPGCVTRRPGRRGSRPGPCAAGARCPAAA